MAKAACSHPSQVHPTPPATGTPGLPGHSRQKAPNMEANPSPDSVQTPQGTERAGANSSQSQPEMHKPSKGITLNPVIKSPSPLDATITARRKSFRSTG